MGVVLIIICSFMWAFVPILTGMLTGSMDPMVLSFYRMALASVMIAVVFIIRKERLGIIKPFLILLLVASLGKAGNYIFMNWGLKLSSVASSVVVLPAQTVFALLFSVLVLRKKTRYGVWVMVLLVIAGISVVSWNGNSLDTLFAAKHFYGNMMLILSGICSGVYLVIQKHLSSKMNSQTVLLYAFSAGTILSFLVSDKSRITFSLSSVNWIALLILGLVITGVGYYILAEGMKRTSIVVSAIILNMSTGLTIILDILFMGEKVSPYIVIGLAAALIGSIGVNYLEIKSGGEAAKQVQFNQ